MYTKCLILTVILFVCTSCELITDKPMKIDYTKSDKLNVIIFLINIPENVTEYKLKSDSSNVEILKHGKVTPYQARQSIILNTDIKNNQNYSVELLKNDRTLCISKNVIQLIANDIKTAKAKNECLVREQACRIQLDFEKKCIDPNTVFVMINSSTRYKYSTWQGSKSTTLYFNEKQIFYLTCFKNETTNLPYNLTWKQYFPHAKEFSINERVPPHTRLVLQITLRKIDDGTAVYCTGIDNETSKKFTFKLNGTQKDVIKLTKIKYNEQKPVTHRCTKDQSLLGKTSTGHFIYYRNGTTVIHKNDTGSIFFCVQFTKPSLVDQFKYYTIRDIYNEVMYIYEDSTADTQGVDNIVIWVSSVFVTAVLMAGGIALIWYKCCRCKNQQHLDQQQQTQVCRIEVTYAEISTFPCRLERRDPVQQEEPYATIIGVLEQHKR